MRFRRLLVAACAAAALGLWALSQVPTGPPPFPALIPPGAVLYLEARDLASLLREWNASPEKKAWLSGSNYQAFSRSRLFLRLGEAQGEFAAAAAVAPDAALLESVAGGNSAIAIYDIGALEFLYITRLASARALETALFKSAPSYQPRNSAGLPYYVRTDPASRRTAAFAAHSDYLLLATREEALAGALARLAGQAGPALKDENWFADAVRAARSPGELRLVLNMNGLCGSAHFRSYWIQRNVSELRQFRAGVSDLSRPAGELREERVFLRAEPAAAAADTAGVGLLTGMAPDTAGLYRAWAAPRPEQVVALLENKLLAPSARAAAPPRFAPHAYSQGPAGEEADLETRIDEAPLENTSGRFVSGALHRQVAEAKPAAMLEVQSSQAGPQAVFVVTEAAVAVLAGAGWNADAVRAAMLEAVDSLYTASGLGMRWVERRAGSRVYHELDGLVRLAVAVDGRVLVAADSTRAMTALLGRIGSPPGPTGVYAAGFRHFREQDNFVRMMRLIDFPSLPAPSPGQNPAGREPMFFSENAGSLSRALARVNTAAIVRNDSGDRVSETVTYRLGR